MPSKRDTEIQGVRDVVLVFIGVEITREQAACVIDSLDELRMGYDPQAPIPTVDPYQQLDIGDSFRFGDRLYTIDSLKLGIDYLEVQLWRDDGDF